MRKKYIVRLTKAERNQLQDVVNQCVSGRRFHDILMLRKETAAWSSNINTTQRGVDWQMKINDARSKLKSVYLSFKL